MKFQPSEIPDVVLIELEPRGDERGFFARTFCEREFAAAGLQTRMVNANMSYSRDKYTLRGMHWQQAPSAEVKVVRCTKGRIYDVAVDIRPDSPTFLKWVGAELSEENRRMFYVPEGFAHGFMTLEDHTEVSYQVSNFYDGPQERGIRWNDPEIGIDWPEEPAVLSEKDAAQADIVADDPRFV
jgi:dTDP-4-dehydrorhamnose 3,5-epimerase